MGNSSSQAHPREPPVSWRAAIWRRLQIWEELKPYLIQVIKAVGLGGTTTVPKLPSPEPHVDPSSTNKEDEAVTVVEMMLVEALRASAANKDADDQPAKPLTEGEPDEVEACQALVRESKEEMTIVRAIRALEKRLVVDLKEPRLGAVRDDKGDGHDHDQDNHDQADHGHGDSHDDEALVARFVRSSLDIAVYRYSFDDNSKLV